MNKDKLKGLMWGSLLGDAYEKKAFTLYGEQVIWLLEYMSESRVYDPFVFGDIWQKKMNAYDGELDKASKAVSYTHLTLPTKA